MVTTTRIAHSENDFDTLMIGCRAFLRLIDRPDIMPDPDSPEAEKVLRDLLWLPNFKVLMAERDSEFTGCLGFFINPYPMNTTKLEFNEIFWWTDHRDPRAAVTLLRDARRLGEDMGVTIWTLNAITKSPPSVAKIYRKVFGAEMMQTTYMGVS